MINFKREIRVTIGGQTFEYPGFTIDFSTNFGDDSDSNDTEIEIYNLSRDTVNQIKKDDPVILNAGYRGDVGTIHLGAVLDVSTEKDGVDRKTTITSTDATEQWNEFEVSETFQSGTRASQALQHFLELTTLEIGALELPDDIEYLRTRTFKGTLRGVIRQIAEDAGAKIHILNGKVFVRDPEDGESAGFFLDKEHGLIGTPERFEDEEESGYKVKALLNHRMTTDALITISSLSANGTYRIRNGTHKASSYFTTEIEVVE